MPGCNNFIPARRRGGEPSLELLVGEKKRRWLAGRQAKPRGQARLTFFQSKGCQPSELLSTFSLSQAGYQITSHQHSLQQVTPCPGVTVSTEWQGSETTTSRVETRAGVGTDHRHSRRLCI